MSFRELIPHAPQIGLFAAPDIPGDKLGNALGDYAETIDSRDVLALYDATLMGSAKDGAVFTNDRVVFQNNDLEPVHEIRYHDIVQVDVKRKLLRGRRLTMTVNRGRATFELEMDFSGKPKAADFVLRFLREAMLLDEPAAAAGASRERSTSTAQDEDETDIEAVSAALTGLRDEGLLSAHDFAALMRVLRP